MRPKSEGHVVERRSRRCTVWYLLLHGLLLSLTCLPCEARDFAVRLETLALMQCGELPWALCKTRLAQRDGEALHVLWERLYTELGHKRRHFRDMSEFLIHTAAEKGYVPAQMDLARQYEYRNDAAAARHWYAAAAANPAATTEEREAAARRVDLLRSLREDARHANLLFLGVTVLVLAPVFLPWGARRRDRGQEFLSAVPNLFNGYFVMTYGAGLSHSVAVGILSVIPPVLLFFGSMGASMVLYGVLLWRSRGRRSYAVTHAVLYGLTIGVGLSFLFAMGGMASQGAGQ